MITVDEYLNQHLAQAAPGELTEEIRANALVTVDRANRLLEAAGMDLGLRSGWRPQAFNASVSGAAKASKHMSGEAVDISDPENKLDGWLTDEKLAELDLYREHPDSTPTWTHVQIAPPKSNKRTFIP